MREGQLKELNRLA